MGDDTGSLRSRSRDPELVATTARLVEFLRDLTSARRERIREVSGYERVLWLADLPDQVVVQQDSEQEEALLSVVPPPGEPLPAVPDELTGWLRPQEVADAAGDAPGLAESGPVELTEVSADGERTARREIRFLDEVPGVRRAYESWLPAWWAWARREREVAVQRRWHQELRAIAERLSQQDDEYELILAVGLLTWKSPDGIAVRNHLLATPVRVTVDGGTERVEARFTERGTSIQDRELLDGLEGFDAVRMEWVRESVRSGEGFGLQSSTAKVLREWCDRAFDHGAVFRDDWKVERSGASAEVRLAPALVLRKRDRASLIAYYDSMLAALSGPDAVAPLGLAQLVTALETDERMDFLREQGAASGDALGTDPLFPLPANPEQRQIMTRLRHDNGVVVQGPPGTGKTHTIANLIAALLAQGQRVLVTSQKAQALRVLRDKLPPEVAQLCVSATDQGRGGSSELEGSVKALSSRFASFDPGLQQRDIAKLTDQLDAAGRDVSRLNERIRALREAETYQHGTISSGYAGTLAEIARLLKRHEAGCSWLPTPMPAHVPQTPPINAAEAAELLSLLAGETPERRARTSQQLPDVSALPTAERVRAMVADEAAARGHAQQAASQLSDRLSTCDDELFGRLEQHTATVARTFHQLGLPEDPQVWDTGDWAVRAIADGLAGREAAVWHQLAEHANRAEYARRMLQQVGFREVTLPAFEASGPGSQVAQLQAARQLRDYLGGGGKLKRGPFRPPAQKQAEPLLLGAAVDGIALTTPELLDVVIAELEGRTTCAELARGWRMVGVDFPAGQPVQRTAAQLADTYARLALVREALAAVSDTVRLLLAAGINVPLADPRGWRAYAAALSAVRLRLQAERATAALATMHRIFELGIQAGQAPPELVGATGAVAGRDAAGYQRCLAALAHAHRERLEQTRCEQLRDRLRDRHPALASLMAAEPAAEGWRSRLGSWEQAWAWGIAATFFATQRRPGLEGELEGELEAATHRRLDLTGRLAAAKAWGACLAKMTAQQAQALRAYQDHMSKLGKGTGRYAERYRSRAREAMGESLGAVPAWIMPLQQVVQTIPALRDSFDVVIVDEASQAGMEALFLLWLAPRMIVVGDDKQCAPSAVSQGELQPIFDKLETYLPELPAYLRDAFTPKSSLFDLLATRFGSVIRLKEHFRCMPEIIDFSSRQFYADEPLVPLRQFGADRLDPLRVVRVDGAVTEGTATRLRNEAEAHAIVGQVLACIADPAYDDKTFGVVVLQGTGQVQLLSTLLLERIDPKEWDRRRLRVGTPPDFQGDERDVVFLSLVVAERRSAVTSTEWQRRFNVAASRAKDQMWLFHSVSLDLLSPSDLRRSLLSYMIAPPANTAGEMLTDVTPDVAHRDFDSLFEQRVFLRIAERRYHVVPQVEVNGRRIDLVVSGAKGRLAVECDGDAWHGTPEQVQDDLDRERELKRAGWRFWRVRGSEFYFDPDAALASLWETLDRYEISPGEVIAAGSPEGDPGWSGITLAGIEGWDGLEGGDPSEMDDVPAAAVRTPVRRRTIPAAPAAPTRPAVRTSRRQLVEEPATGTAEAAAKPPEQAPAVRHSAVGAQAVRPALAPGKAVTAHSRADLIALMRWLERDGRDRTVAELMDEAVSELGVEHTRAGTELLQDAIRASRKGLRRSGHDIEGSDWYAGADEVRAWARASKYGLDEDGGIPDHVIIAYNRANPDRPHT
jgi:very-short-patch-repair endonuclease